MQYNKLNYIFNIDDTSFQVSMAALEKFERFIPSHSHGKDCYEIHYIISGKGTAIINGITYPIDKDTLYITGPYIVHEQIPFTQDPMVEYCIYLRFLQKNKKAASSRNSILSSFEEHPFWFGHDTQNIRPIMQMIFFELEHKNMGHHALLKALFQQLIIYIVRNYTNNTPNKPIPEFAFNGHTSLLSIEEAFLYDYKDITLNQLAKRMNISSRQAERLLKQYYNNTFQKKRTEARMSAASVLLKSSNYSISCIAEMTGYSSSEHFSHAFKRYFGVSASEYRKNMNY